MAKLLKLRRGSTSDHSSFTGAEGEVTVDTDKETLVVHNGAQAGGFPLARADQAAALTGATFTGDVTLNATKELRFADTDSSNYVGFEAPGTIASNKIWVLPAADGSAGEFLKTDGSGNLSWAADTTGLAAPSSAGTVDASKGVQVDANKDVTGFRNVTLTGELDAATGDFSGDVDIDGVTNLDNVDIDGTVQIDNTVTVGVNDTGYDVKFFGATSGAYMLWDEDVDDLILAGAARAVVPDGQLVLGSTAVTSTATELNLLDGKTAVGDASVGTDQEWTKPQRGDVTVATHSSAGDYDFDLDVTNNFKLTISAACALGFSNLDATREGQTGTIYIDNGAITPTWGDEVQFEGGSSGTISITQNKKSLLAYYVLPGGSKVLVTAILDVADD